MVIDTLGYAGIRLSMIIDTSCQKVNILVSIVLISKFSEEDTQELSVACRYRALSHFSLICGASVTSPETEGRGECPAPYSDLVSPTKEPGTMMAIATLHL